MHCDMSVELNSIFIKFFFRETSVYIVIIFNFVISIPVRRQLDRALPLPVNAVKDLWPGNGNVIPQ